MRAILVGRANARNGLRWELEALSIQIIGEFDTMAEARRSGGARSVATAAAVV